jgi:hypothetical protein
MSELVQLVKSRVSSSMYNLYLNSDDGVPEYFQPMVALAVGIESFVTTG